MADTVRRTARVKRDQKEAALVAFQRAEANVPRHRFGLAYLLLAAIMGAAVGLFVVFATNGGKTSSPAVVGVAADRRAASRHSTRSASTSRRQYALPNGRVLVTPFSDTAGRPDRGSARRRRARSGSATGLPGETLSDSQVIDASSAWAYELCGAGKNCAISEGTASAARGRLLQRESLELALYTFKFEPAIDYRGHVLPPGLRRRTPAAILLTRQALEEPLKHPLAQTLPPPRTRLVPGQLSARDLAVIDRYIPRAYTFSGEQLQDGSPVLVLRPVS